MSDTTLLKCPHGVRPKSFDLLDEALAHVEQTREYYGGTWK